ncbi:MAG: hypothetical protein ACYDES_13730 [Acidimicrobiales bacterium]
MVTPTITQEAFRASSTPSLRHRATENALRPLLTRALAGSLIGGCDEWVALNADGSLTGSGREQLNRCRELVSETTQALTAGIDPAAVQTTIDTLDTVRTRAEQLLAR